MYLNPTLFHEEPFFYVPQSKDFNLVDRYGC